MSNFVGKFIAFLAAAAFALTVAAVAPAGAHAASPYDRPNAIHCVAHGVFINAPTNVPVTGEVLWQAEVQTYNTSTNQWERKFLAPHMKNFADPVQITAGPWADADGNPNYSTLVAITAGTGRVEIRVYNHFWRADQGQWVYVNDGWFSTIDGTATAPQTCILDNGPIVV